MNKLLYRALPVSLFTPMPFALSLRAVPVHTTSTNNVKHQETPHRRGSPCPPSSHNRLKLLQATKCYTPKYSANHPISALMHRTHQTPPPPAAVPWRWHRAKGNLDAQQRAKKSEGAPFPGVAAAGCLAMLSARPQPVPCFSPRTTVRYCFGQAPRNGRIEPLKRAIAPNTLRC